ncbi:hypothetical protein [Labilibacter marinus]|uniref:hypothetical protein n=1 Tax=Labilibacter marinus TaxID=1477105 RepID=UPI00094FC058|nr:hypothetical protein [Labilibacter marinus]
MKKINILFLHIFILGLFATTFNSCKDDEVLLIQEVVLTWEDPAELVTGLPLTKEQLNATANVPGTMVFTPSLETVLPLGDNQELKVEFTPRDTKNYSKMSKTVAINIVEKYVPVITWENPAVLPEGEPLTEEQLNATADVEGTFVYTPALGTILSLGENQELKVDFTPSVPTHQPTSKTVLINVRDVVPLSIIDNSAMWTGAQTIAFDIKGAVGSLGGNPATGFTVHVKHAGKFVDQDFDITDVTFDPANASTIVLTLAKEIYADDMITIVYNQEGNTILSTDEQPLKSFDMQKVSIPVAGDDLLVGNSWGGFEGEAGADSGGAAGYWVGNGGLPWARTTDMFASGVASMQFSGAFDVNTLYGMAFGNNVDIKAGAFEITHEIYIEAGSDLKTIRTEIARKSNGWATDVAAVWDVENIARGEWVTLKQVINIPVDINSIDPTEKMRYSYFVEASHNTGVTGDQTFYLDDMGLRKVDVAPRP